jgi:carbon monoxide dehydrogenase subunit G
MTPWPTLCLMAGSTLTVARRIAAPQQQVWDVISDIAGSAERITAIAAIEVLSGDAIGVGTRWTETRLVSGRKFSETLEITKFDPPALYVVEGDSCGAHFTTDVCCTRDGDDATMLTMTMVSEPQTIMAKMLSPLCKLATKSMRKMLDKDLDDIARACSGVPDDEDAG